MALPTRTGPDPSLQDLLSARPAFEMHASDGLCFENVPLNAIADAVGTPTWVYGASSIRTRFGRLKAAFETAGLKVHVHYAVKANDHLAILDLFQRLGAGADVVSQGEFMRVQRAGIPAEDVVYSGVGKSPHGARRDDCRRGRADQYRECGRAAHDLGGCVRNGPARRKSRSG